MYAIRKLAGQQFPELAKAIEAERENAKARKAQAKGQPRGQKALIRSQDRHSESADRIGAQIGVSGTTVKRVDRLAREAPELLPRVAAGELSVKRALREVAQKAEKDARGHHYSPALQAASEAEKDRIATTSVWWDRRRRGRRCAPRTEAARVSRPARTRGCATVMARRAGAASAST